MYRKLGGWLAIGLAVGGLMLFLWSMVGTAGASSNQSVASVLQTPLASPVEPPRRESDGAQDTTLISFIDSPTAECYRPRQYTNVCYINWYSTYVSASSSQYIISMTVSIDNRLRAYYAGFFQTSMYVPYEMQNPGFKVDCGLPGASGYPDLGQAYAYTIRARETGGLKAANYGTVYCPADIVPVKQANLTGPPSGFIHQSYSFMVSVPTTTTLPVSYTWTVTGQAPVTINGGVNNLQTFSWDTLGAKSVSVQVANRGGTLTAAQMITINDHRLYLPVITH